MNKILNYIIHPKKIVLYLIYKMPLPFINDESFLKLKYNLILNKKLNLDNPMTFNEKLQWLKLYDHNDNYTMMVDKYKVRNYISEMIGEEYLIPLIGVYNDYEEIDFDSLPNQFVIKPNHTSGDVFICKDKNDINHKALRKMINKWLKKDYYLIHREWPYKNVERKIIIEKYMKDNSTNELTDYKVMCFNGKTKNIFTCTDRYTDGLKVTFFDLNWNKLPFSRHYPSSKKEISKPKNLDIMIELSEKLAKNIPFVRVDWYEINKKLYFGELTFYPGSGYEEFTPEVWDEKLGEMIDLSEVDK